jgi:threonine dehydrogenase-like Zn-dependent dehydrogenase
MLSGRTSLYFSGLVSMPMVPGHEIVADLLEDCEDLPAGTRVVVDPVLGYAARGLEPVAGQPSNLSDGITVGSVSPGLQTGFCHDTGGGWGQVLVAHRSQLYAVPPALSDGQALLTEPVACAVHTALRARVERGARVLVSGAGAVGLFTTLALRQLTMAGDITVVAKHKHQRDLALAFGATDVVAPGEVVRGVRRATRALQVQPELGRPFLLGGVDIAIDAVGSRTSIETALQVTRAGGRVVLSGMPAPADFSAAWFRELEVLGSYASANAEPAAAGRSCFELAGELVAAPVMEEVASGIVSYALHRWREALDHAHSAGRLGTVKVAFDPRSTR